MILDTINNLHLYKDVNPYINKVIDFLANLDTSNLPQGRVEIYSDNLYANFMIAKGKTTADAFYESHNRYIDIQIVFDHEEEIGWIPREELPEQEYHDADDYTLYPKGLEIKQTVNLIPGYFALFLPEDGHAPCISDAESYHKVVFKLKVQ